MEKTFYNFPKSRCWAKRFSYRESGVSGKPTLNYLTQQILRSYLYILINLLAFPSLSLFFHLYAAFCLSCALFHKRSFQSPNNFTNCFSAIFSIIYVSFWIYALFKLLISAAQRPTSTLEVTKGLQIIFFFRSYWYKAIYFNSYSYPNGLGYLSTNLLLAHSGLAFTTSFFQR